MSELPMENIYSSKVQKRSESEWEIILDNLMDELSNHLEIDLNKCSYFIEEQIDGEASYGCNIDFRGVISKSLQMEICGILCYSVNWNERVHIGAYLLYFQGIARLTPNGDDESVVYIPREIGGWGKAHVEVGEGCEWSRYDSPVRWDEK